MDSITIIFGICFPSDGYTFSMRGLITETGSSLNWIGIESGSQAGVYLQPEN